MIGWLRGHPLLGLVALGLAGGIIFLVLRNRVASTPSNVGANAAGVYGPFLGTSPLVSQGVADPFTQQVVGLQAQVGNLMQQAMVQYGHPPSSTPSTPTPTGITSAVSDRMMLIIPGPGLGHPTLVPVRAA